MSTDCSQRPKLNILFLRLAIEVRFVHVTCGTYMIEYWQCSVDWLV